MRGSARASLAGSEVVGLVCPTTSVCSYSVFSSRSVKCCSVRVPPRVMQGGSRSLVRLANEVLCLCCEPSSPRSSVSAVSRALLVRCIAKDRAFKPACGALFFSSVRYYIRLSDER